MRKLMLVFVAVSVAVSIVGANPVSGQKVVLKMKNATLETLFDRIESQTGCAFLYDGDLPASTFDVDYNGEELDVVLTRVLTPLDLSWFQRDQQIVITSKDEAKASMQPARQNTESKVSGVVRDAGGAPLTGATVILPGTNIYAITDEHGRFELDNVPDGATISVSFVGYNTVQVPLKNRTGISISLTEDVTSLKEVVVVGYGVQKKVNVTGAVSSVRIDALESRPITNVQNALAGLAAGLSVRSTGGNTPGYESFSILVRGVGTLNNSGPLVVIDGTPGSAISDINPHDVESISILKDAASSAIYGSRAANGVILITTKKGTEGKIRVTYSGNVSFEKVARRLNLVTRYADYMEIQNAGLVANGQAPRFSQGKIDEWRNDVDKNPTIYPNTDWQDHIYRKTSVVQSHNISVDGNSGTARYSISLGHVNNPGMIYNTNYKRYQARTNLEVDVKPWLTFGSNVYGFLDSNNPSASNASAGGDVIWGFGAFSTVPGMTLYDPATGLYGGIQNPEEVNVSNANPYRRMWFFKNEFPVLTRRIAGTMHATLKPVKGLTIRGSYTMNWWDRKEEYHLTDRNLYRFTADGPVLLREGKVRTYIHSYNSYDLLRSSDLTANYHIQTGRLEASAMVGASQEYNKDDYEQFLQYDMSDESLTSINAGLTDGFVRGDYNEWAMRSFFGRVNLAWDNKYLFEANFRADASSKFAPAKRWGHFPSVSVGWRMSEEPFMKGAQNWLSQLKLRASYGSLGNNATSSYYMYQSLYSPSNYILGGTNISSGLAQAALSNPELTWESTYVTNLGVDFGFLKNRLSGSFEWFDRDTKDILMSIPAPLEHGTSTLPNVNAGAVNNKGIDIDLNWTDRIGAVTYRAGFNLGFVTNRVTKFHGEVPVINGAYKTQEGKPMNQLYALKVDRIVRDISDLDYVQSLVDKNPNYFNTYQRPELGDFLYADANGDGNLDQNDKVEMGHGSNPRFTYGANIGLEWKGINFSMLLQGVGKNQIYYQNQAYRFVTVLGQSLIKDITDNAWTPENPYNSKYPKLRNNGDLRNSAPISDAYILDASYLRCKNIQLGYTLPGLISKKFFVDKFNVYASVDNLFTITKFRGLDPEVGANVGYPTVRQYSFGVNVTF